MRLIPAGHHCLCDVSTGFFSAHTLNDATAAGRNILNESGYGMLIKGIEGALAQLFDGNKAAAWESRTVRK